jgi:F0F1-type ATP synthase membrane subunit c/vacuolar-type H+-ATPase subunit K
LSVFPLLADPNGQNERFDAELGVALGVDCVADGVALGVCCAGVGVAFGVCCVGAGVRGVAAATGILDDFFSTDGGGGLLTTSQRERKSCIVALYHTWSLG